MDHAQVPIGFYHAPLPWQECSEVGEATQKMEECGSLARNPKQWMRRVQGTESHYYRAIGSAEALMAKAADLGQRWMKGIS